MVTIIVIASITTLLLIAVIIVLFILSLLNKLATEYSELYWYVTKRIYAYKHLMSEYEVTDFNVLSFRDFVYNPFDFAEFPIDDQEDAENQHYDIGYAMAMTDMMNLVLGKRRKLTKFVLNTIIRLANKKEK